MKLLLMSSRPSALASLCLLLPVCPLVQGSRLQLSTAALGPFDAASWRRLGDEASFPPKITR